MSCLDATFTLTPRYPRYTPASPGKIGVLACHGADFLWTTGADFSSLYSADRFFFEDYTAADPSPNIDYSQWSTRIKVPHLEFWANLSGFGTAKSLALVFGFEASTSGGGRVLVYTDAEKISEQTLAFGDDQFLLEIESLDNFLHLYFIHAGGLWSFKGLSGYVV